MIEIILGSKNKERVLLYIYARKEGYGLEISRYFNTSLSPIQNQLDNLEKGGVLSSKLIGKTRMYYFNPRYPYLMEISSILEKVIYFLPEDEREKLLIYRKRPRRKGKKL
ncbi:MAG TPA: winged helix-turn-helix domain-containing protein [Ignavibacteria bacterium]|nr:winged helix-turn-helix domain-containing protein [Ignavibacteria bacterium]